MANFEPLKKYIFLLMDRLIDQYSLSGPFLDAGCGRGDVSLYLAQKGWEGLAVDFSPGAVQVARGVLQPYKVRVEAMDLLAVKGEFRTIVMATVIEHVKDDSGMLRHLRTLYPKDGGKGYFLVSIPTKESEWRWDDNFYGHYRRYEREQFEKLLADCGFRTLEFWDYSFPIFWLMRRMYTWLLIPKVAGDGSKEDHSAASSLRSAWEMGKFSLFLSKLPVWWLVFALQYPFRRSRFGSEAIVLAETV